MDPIQTNGSTAKPIGMSRIASMNFTQQLDLLQHFYDIKTISRAGPQHIITNGMIIGDKAIIAIKIRNLKPYIFHLLRLE